MSRTLEDILFGAPSPQARKVTRCVSVIAAAALLLMSPGFASDIIALILMLPFKGRPLETADFNTGAQREPRGQYGDVIEGEYTVSDADPVPPSHTLPQDKRG